MITALRPSVMDPFEPGPQAPNRTPLDNEAVLSGEFWGELRVFLAVAKAKSFNRAAELLGTSQPTVSRRVKRLQDVMGSQLFLPTKQGVRLTPKGQALAEALTRLDHSLFALASDLRAETTGAEGLVRISAADGLNASFVAPAARAFSDAYPQIRLHLKGPANVPGLRANQTDLMVGFGAMPPGSAGLTCRRLGRLHLLPVAAKGYIRRFGLPTLSTIENHWFLQDEAYLAGTGLWEPWSRIVARGRVAHVCDDPAAYAALARAELGIALLGSYATLDPAVFPLQLGVLISVPLYAVALTERLKAKPVALAFDWLCGLFGDGNPWFRDEFRLDLPDHDAGPPALAQV